MSFPPRSVVTSPSGRNILVFSLAISLSIAVTSVTSGEGLAIGDKLPAFSLPGVDGKMHSSEAYRESPLLLVLFTCNHCPTAQAYETRIKKLQAEYSPQGLQLVAISPNDAEAVRLDELGYSDLGDSLEEMKLRAKEAGFRFPYLYDGETQKVSRQFGAKATPHAFLFDAERKLRYAGRIDDGEVGPVKRHDLREAVDALLAGRPVEVATTRVFGCSVKWSDKRGAAAESIQKWQKEPVELETIDEAGLKKLVAGDGENYRLINLWATWCGPCVTELPRFVEINRIYRRRHFEVVTISMDEPDANEDALKILRQSYASTKNYHSAITDTDQFAEAFDPDWPGPLPYTVLIAPGGEIVYRKEGEIDALELRREIVKRIGRTYASRK